MKKNIFDKLSFLSLFLIIVFLPIFFLPNTGISIEISKGILLVSGLTLSIIFWSIARFFDGKIVLPRSALAWSSIFVVLATFVSAFVSKSSQVSFFGTMFDVGSFWFIFSGFLFLFMAAVLVREQRDAKVILFGTLLSSLLVLLLQGVRVFFPQLLSLGVLGDKTANLVGSWISFGIFAGFSCLMSLLIMEFFSTTKLEKIFLAALICVSLFLVAVVNFPLIWILLGISSLVMFTYKVSNAFTQNLGNPETEGKSHFPVFAFLITLVSLFFFMSGSLIGGWVPAHLNISNNEVSPAISANLYLVKSVLHDHPLFGIGPNRFLEAWSMYKPLSVNNGVFWDVAFSFGSGLIPTLISTVGLVGILAWLIFFILLIVGGVKSIFSSIKNSNNWEVMAFFVLSLYLFVSLFLYAGGVVLFLLALGFTGVFVGLSSSNNSIEISFLNDHRKSFFSILSLILLIILSAAMAFTYVERFLSVYYFAKSLSTDNIAVAEDSISKALTLYNNDLYLRTYEKVNLIKMNNFVKKNPNNLSDEDKATLQSYLDQAVRGAQTATLYNPNSYLNWTELASLYVALANFGVKDAYGKSIEAFKKAETLNPNNPGIKLSIAGSYYAMQSYKDAKDYANKALSVKPDYIDAYVVLAQILKSEGDTSDAIAYAEQALKLSPLNKDLIQYIDSLKGSSNANVVPPTTAIPVKPNKK